MSSYWRTGYIDHKDTCVRCGRPIKAFAMCRFLGDNGKEGCQYRHLNCKLHAPQPPSQPKVSAKEWSDAVVVMAEHRDPIYAISLQRLLGMSQSKARFVFLKLCDAVAFSVRLKKSEDGFCSEYFGEAGETRDKVHRYHEWLRRNSKKPVDQRVESILRGIKSLAANPPR